MKKIILLLLLPVFVFAAVSPDHQTQSLLNDFETASSTWRGALLPAAKQVFYYLTVMDWVLEFGFIAITAGLELGTIWAPLIRKTLVISFFLMLFDRPDWLMSIPRSFLQLGTNASGVPVNVDSVFNYGIDIVSDLWHGISIFAPGDSLALVFTGIILIIAFAMMAAQLAVTSVKMYALLAVAPLVFSLAGLTQTRQMAYNPFFAIIKVGMELLFITLFMGMTITKMQQFAAHVDTDNNSILTMIAMAILMVSVVQMIPGMVESLMSGSLGSNSTAGFGTAQAVASGVGGAVGGAIGAGAAVKAASNLAKEQRAGGDTTASTFKNLRSAFANDVQRSMAGENIGGGSMGARMAFKHSSDSSLMAQTKAMQGTGSSKADVSKAQTANEEAGFVASQGN